MIKITPIMLFSILLIVLVISVIMGNHFMNKEGFVSFQKSKKSREIVYIPQYSTKKQVTKLADNMFFDSINGNLIELDAARYDSSEDTTGVSINNVLVTPRVDAQNYTYTYPVKNGKNQDVKLSLLDNVASSFRTILYPSQCKNTTNTNTIYVPWGDTTYIGLIGKSEDKPAVEAVPTSGTAGASAAVPGTWSVQQLGMFGHAYTADLMTPPNANEFITGYVEDNDAANNTMVIEPFYHNVNKVLQLSKYVKLDLLTDSLIIQTKEGDAKSITIYTKNGEPKVVSSMPTTFPAITESHVKTNFISRMIIDTLGQNAVLCMSISNKMVVILVRFTDATKSALTLRNVVRIENGVIVNVPTSVAQATPTPTTVTAPTVQVPGSVDASNNPISEYFKWYWYWKNSTPIENNPDYLLKTQIIPPVCPASAPCPSCQQGTTTTTSQGTATTTTTNQTPGQTCTNCGGQGGSGTLTTDGKSVVNPGLGKVVDNTVSTVGGVATKTVDTAGNLLKDTGSGAVNLLKDTGSGTVNLLKDTSSGAVNLLKDTASGAKNLLKDTGSGLSHFLRSADRDRDRDNNANNGNVVVNNQRNTVYQDGALGTQTQYTSDPYSYQGQLVPKSGSQYMPITADFSSFAK